MMNGVPLFLSFVHGDHQLIDRTSREAFAALFHMPHGCDGVGHQPAGFQSTAH